MKWINVLDMIDQSSITKLTLKIEKEEVKD